MPLSGCGLLAATPIILKMEALSLSLIVALYIQYLERSQ